MAALSKSDSLVQVDYPEPPKSRYNTEGFGRDDNRDGGRKGRGGPGKGRGGRSGGKQGQYSRHGGASKHKKAASEFERFG